MFIPVSRQVSRAILFLFCMGLYYVPLRTIMSSLSSDGITLPLFALSEMYGPFESKQSTKCNHYLWLIIIFFSLKTKRFDKGIDEKSFLIGTSKSLGRQPPTWLHQSCSQMLHSCILCCGARCANNWEQEDMCWLCCRVSRLWTGLGSRPTDSVTSAVIWRCSVMHPLSTGTLVIIRCQHLSFQVPFVPAAYRQILGWKGGNYFSYVLSNSAQVPISPEYRSACSLRWTRAEQSNIFLCKNPDIWSAQATQLDVCRNHMEWKGHWKMHGEGLFFWFY